MQNPGETRDLAVWTDGLAPDELTNQTTSPDTRRVGEAGVARLTRRCRVAGRGRKRRRAPGAALDHAEWSPAPQQLSGSGSATLQNRNSLADTSAYALLMRYGGQDWIQSKKVK